MLTLELLEGPTLKEFLNTITQRSNAERFQASRLIMRAVWGPAYADASQYLHVYVGRLRHKLADAGAGPIAERLFVTETGIGYRVADAESLAETT